MKKRQGAFQGVSTRKRVIIPLLVSVAMVSTLSACGGGSGSSSGGSSSGSSSSSGGASSSSGSSSSGGAGASAAAALAKKLGRPARLLTGLGTTEVADVQAQALKPDLFDRYLVGVGASSWPSWNSPSGAYVSVVAAEADSIGAVPMFTLYQMASNGDGNLSGLADSTFMTQYWANVRLMFQKLGTYGKPAVVNLEPDFWGYVEQQATRGDPTKLVAQVTLDADCAGLPNDVTGVAACLVRSARKYAPKAYVGFPISEWGSTSTTAVIAFMNQIGANTADFIVFQTLDRDAGCFEVLPQPASCQRAGSGWYWDEANITHPDFADHLALVKQYHLGIGGLPVLWWQTPLGVPSTTPGGTNGHYRDNRVHYFLTHATQLVAAGGLGVVFSAGATGQTDITTDGGQFRALSAQYLATPAPLP